MCPYRPFFHLLMPLALLLAVEPFCFGQQTGEVADSALPTAQAKSMPGGGNLLDGGVVDRDAIERLVDELGSNQFLVREHAHERLDALDEACLPILTELQSKSTDPEVQARLWSIVARRKNEILQRNSKEFIRAATVDENHPYRGWKSFSKAAGSQDRKARFTLLAILEEYPELVNEEIVTKQDAFRIATLVASRITERLDIRGEVTDADGIALVYTACLCEDALDPQLERTCHRVFMRFPFSRNINPEFSILDQDSQGGKIGSTLASMYTKWVDYAKDEQRVLLTCLNAAIPASKKIAKRILESKEATNDPLTFELAMQAMARFGKIEDAEAVDRWLEDQTTIRDVQRIAPPNAFETSFEIYEVRACDLALASTMLLHGYSPAQLVPMFRSHPLRGYSTESLGLPAKIQESYRVDRLKQWREILRLQPPAPQTLKRLP
jgi:hypothetical protein